jgi:hypothetical protein
MGNYRCYDNFLNTQYKNYYNLAENCLSSSALFTEYGYGRIQDSNENLFVVQLYSFLGEEDGADEKFTNGVTTSESVKPTNPGPNKVTQPQNSNLFVLKNYFRKDHNNQRFSYN